MLGPELKEIQKRYKGDRVKRPGRPSASSTGARRQPARRLPADAAPDLPADPDVLGLQPGPHELQRRRRWSTVFGVELFDLNCAAAPIVDAAGHVMNPCLDPIAFGINWGVPEVIIGTAGGFASGLSILRRDLGAAPAGRVADGAAGRTTPAMADDQNTRIQRQMALLFPFISLTYGSLLPAGLFLYWIVSTLFSIVQQYLIIGWGGMFPLFGWTSGLRP